MATLYFNGAVDGDWNELGNWWENSSYTIPASSLPTSSDDVIIDVVVTTNSGGPLSVINLTHNANGGCPLYITVSGSATFNAGYNNAGTIDGVGIFNDGTVNNGTVTGLAYFNGSSGNGSVGSTSGDAYFYNTSTNDGSVGGNAIVDYSHAVPFDSSNGNNGTVTGSILYANFPTLYYNNATTDGNWANNLNWWVDDMYTQQAYSIPTSSTTVYVAGFVGSDSLSSATADTAYFGGGYTIAINLNIINDATFTDNSYGDNSSPVTLTANNVYFNATSLWGVTTDANISFGDECRFTGDTFNNGTVSANGSGTGSTFFDDNSSNTGTVGVGATSYTVDFSDTSTNTGTVNINTNANYPLNRNSFNTGTISGTINYISYPTFYFYGGNDWNNTSYWWTGTGGTGVNAAYVPNSLDTVVIESDPINTTSNIYALSATLESTFGLGSSYTFYVTNTITINSGSIGNGFSPAVVTAGSAEFYNSSGIMGGSVQLTVSSGASFYDTTDITSATITGNVNFYDSSTFSSGSISGDATVYSPHILPFSAGGTIGGSLIYSGYSSRTIYFYNASSTDWSDVNNWWLDSGHSNPALYGPDSAVSLDDIFIDSSVTSNTLSSPTTVGVLTVNASSNLAIDITCSTATFNSSSTFGVGNTVAVLTQVSSTVSVTFSDLSSNYASVLVTDTMAGTPAVVFEDGSSNQSSGYVDGNADVYYPVTLPLGGTVTGTTYYFQYPLYFNDNVGITPTNDGNWNNSNNWYLDSGNTVLAGSTPSETYPGVNVTLQTSVTTSTGGTPTAYDLSCGSNSSLSITNTNITVYGLATFENDGTLGSGATINGDALFKDTSTCESGTVANTATFTLTSAAIMIYNGYDGTYGSSVTDVQFEYGKGVNGSSILGLV